MRTSIATVCLSGTLEEKMRGAARAGFDGIEVFEPDLVASPLSPEQVADLAAELGLTLDLYQPFRDLEGVEAEVFAANLRRLEAKFQLMRCMGMDLILLCSNVGTATRWEDEVAIDQLRQAADLAAGYGIRIAYEALAWGRYVSTYEHAWSLVEQADRPNLGVCLDSFHILSRRGDVTGFRSIPGEKIFFVQLADAPNLLLDLLSWSRHHRTFPGEGAFDLVGFYRELVATGYAGPLSLEVFSDVYRQTDTPRTALAAMRSLHWLQEATAHPDEAADLQPRGWDYAEVLAAEPQDVTEILAALGFQDRGPHRTKDVRLYAAGDARVVLNGRPRPRGEDGSELVGLGLQVPDPRATMDRARLLQYPVAWRSNRADEMVLRGVTAPDGSELFVAPVPDEGREPGWTGEFGPDATGRGTGHLRATDAPASSAGESLILGVDHVNLAQPWQWFDEGVLFYRALFGLHARANNEVASPQGLVRSQVVQTDDASVRLALNMLPQVLEGTDEGRRRRRADFPEHVAFLSSDVAEVARRARRAGLRFLPIPANYYEDLHARFDLDEGLLRVLRENDLMYDRDERGEFLHFYTRTVGSVFFEVVERRGGYDGYGAMSAPVRLAAQYDVDRQ
ncbi:MULTISPECIES: sugar phosphate isomerase/epimerase and 4-hydroxyphenylpyruvate domain-containing protein [Micrococcaceae]|uniref:sugar phosphate isomerase/epimerase and 4-hydroxyphenylpyruvate domain-containing protein n=1 Tax=Micrococcaceae TaxID=1268 RepID=UPI00160910A8|nr:sugar phosphate isomerase/epimerase and 4-hydroxyphenylpyruvate domain-containing protein [Citricoccus sp.]MBB5748186.1 4-hydroxyphenylpyruvate dioxygenase [Micrococcus sp. TA1]HRO30610.1 TIM barrel protein [Citricoccus sp.]HRO94433.1 TIM barrel protein [Citricoccus sp.]